MINKSVLEDYIDSIKSGKETVGFWVRQLYLKIIDPIVQGKSDKYFFDPEASSDFFNFVDLFCLNTSNKDWIGKKLVFLPWQKAVYDTLFGIKIKETGIRRFNEVFIEMGSKNGKTEFTYPLVLYMIGNYPGVDAASCATDLAQAKILYRKCVTAIDLNPSLNRHYFDHKDYPPITISTKPETKLHSTFSPLAHDSSKDRSKWDGFEYYLSIIDEVHAADYDTYASLKQRQSTYTDPIMWLMGTAGKKRCALFDDKREYNKKVLLGLIQNDSVLPLLYEIDHDDLNLIQKDKRPKEDDPFDCYIWKKANPSLGIIKKENIMKQAAVDAQTMPNDRITFFTKDLNYIGGESSGYLPADVIINEEVYSGEQLKLLDGSICVGSYDLSRTNDLTAVATMLFDNKKKKIIFMPQFFCTEDFLESKEAKRADVPWRAWIEQGWLKISGQSKINYHDITDYFLNQVSRHGYIYQNIGYDSWSATFLIDELNGYGWSSEGKCPCQIPVIQGFKSLSLPMQESESLLKEKKLVFQNNPMLVWMFSNVELVEDRNGNMMPRKSGEGDSDRSSKIDGYSALLDCLYCYELNKNAFMDI